jgi:hypothetical protein
MPTELKEVFRVRASTVLGSYAGPSSVPASAADVEVSRFSHLVLNKDTDLWEGILVNNVDGLGPAGTVITTHPLREGCRRQEHAILIDCIKKNTVGIK